MERKKNRCILLITIGVLIISGMLPVLTAWIEDAIVDDNVCYEEVKTVQLFKQLNDVQKMYLLEQGISVKISEERASLKREQMQEVIEIALSNYLELGYIKAQLSDFSITKCEPILYYSNTESNLSGIFWDIQMELWDELGQSISLYVDDQTGKVLLISYECLESIFDKEDCYSYLEEIYTIYQMNMDWNMINGEYRGESEMRNEQNFIFYRMGDIIYGEIGLEFMISDTGFKIGFD